MSNNLLDWDRQNSSEPTNLISLKTSVLIINLLLIFWYFFQQCSIFLLQHLQMTIFCCLKYCPSLHFAVCFQSLHFWTVFITVINYSSACVTCILPIYFSVFSFKIFFNVVSIVEKDILPLLQSLLLIFLLEIATSRCPSARMFHFQCHPCRMLATGLPVGQAAAAPPSIRGVIISAVSETRNEEVSLQPSFLWPFTLSPSQAKFLLNSICNVCLSHSTLIPAPHLHQSAPPQAVFNLVSWLLFCHCNPTSIFSKCFSVPINYVKKPL